MNQSNKATIVTVRLSEELLARVEAQQETGFDNRSDTLRTLIELGIERDKIHLRMQDLEEKLDRLMHIAEQQYKISYLTALMAKEGRKDIEEKMSDFQAAATQALATTLVKKFGE